MNKAGSINFRCDMELKRSIEALAKASGVKASEYMVGVLTAAVEQSLLVTQHTTWNVAPSKHLPARTKKRA
jgi:hypothetical protein